MARSTAQTGTMEEAQVRFEEWRRNRQGHKAIPEELRLSAMELARQGSVFSNRLRAASGRHEVETAREASGDDCGERRSRRVRGTAGAAWSGHWARTAGVHDRTGRAPWQVADSMQRSERH
jgi:hypothetical protein